MTNKEQSIRNRGFAIAITLFGLAVTILAFRGIAHHDRLTALESAPRCECDAVHMVGEEPGPLPTVERDW